MDVRDLLIDNLNKKKYNKQIYIDIFNILSEDNTYSHNSCGIFFNLRNSDKDSIKKANSYIEKIHLNEESYNKFIEEREYTLTSLQKKLTNRKIEHSEKKKENKTFKEVIDLPVKKREVYGNGKNSYQRIYNIINNYKSEDKKSKNDKNDEEKDKEWYDNINLCKIKLKNLDMENQEENEETEENVEDQEENLIDELDDEDDLFGDDSD